MTRNTTDHALTILDATAKAGLSIDFAKELIDAKLTPEQVSERIEAKLIEIRVEAERVEGITALCDAQNLSSLRSTFVQNKAISVETARNLMHIVRAEIDRAVNGDKALSTTSAKIDARSVYAQRANAEEKQ